MFFSQYFDHSLKKWVFEQGTAITKLPTELS